MAKVDIFLNYRLQSGQHAGRSLVACLLENFPEWQIFYDKLPADSCRKNQLHLALECLLPKIRSLEPTKLCPICGRRPVHLFSLEDYGGFFNPPTLNKVCCSDKNCVHNLEYWSGGKLRILNFESFKIRSHFGRKRPIDKTALQKLLVEVYELPDLSDDLAVINYLQKRFKYVHRKIA